MLNMALGLPEELSQSSVLALEVQNISEGLLLKKRFVKLGIVVYYRLQKKI